jgi:Glutamine synthetase, catalytic domain
MLMAGLDGVKSEIEPSEPMDKDLYGFPLEEKRSVKQVPGSQSTLEVLFVPFNGNGNVPNPIAPAAAVSSAGSNAN